MFVVSTKLDDHDHSESLFENLSEVGDFKDNLDDMSNKVFECLLSQQDLIEEKDARIRELEAQLANRDRIENMTERC